MQRSMRVLGLLAALALLASCIEFDDGAVLEASTTASSRAAAVAWGDVADRGVADPLVVTDDGTVVRLTACGAGCWQREETVALGSAGSAIAVGDLDGDDVDDVVVGTAAGVRAYFGGAAGPGRTAGLVAADSAEVIGAAEPYGDLSGGSVVLGDLDGDDDLDVVVRGISNVLGGPVSTLATVAGDGAGGFAALTGARNEYLSAGATAVGPVVGDVDGDGADEVMMAEGHAIIGTSYLVVYEGLAGGGTGSIEVGITASFATGDLDGDTMADVAVRTPGVASFDPVITPYCSTGTTFLACGEPLATGDDGWSGGLSIVDMDDDGRSDVVTLGLDRVSVWRGTGPKGADAFSVGARSDHTVVGAARPFAVEPGVARPDLLVALHADRAAVRHLDNVTP